MHFRINHRIFSDFNKCCNFRRRCCAFHWLVSMCYLCVCLTYFLNNSDVLGNESEEKFTTDQAEGSQGEDERKTPIRRNRLKRRRRKHASSSESDLSEGEGVVFLCRLLSELS